MCLILRIAIPSTSQARCCIIVLIEYYTRISEGCQLDDIHLLQGNILFDTFFAEPKFATLLPICTSHGGHARLLLTMLARVALTRVGPRGQHPARAGGTGACLC